MDPLRRPRKPTRGSEPAPDETPADVPPPDEKLAQYVLSPQVERLFEDSTSRVRMIIEVNLDPVEHASTENRRSRRCSGR